jgi:hypothetical protein
VTGNVVLTGLGAGAVFGLVLAFGLVLGLVAVDAGLVGDGAG